MNIDASYINFEIINNKFENINLINNITIIDKKEIINKYIKIINKFIKNNSENKTSINIYNITTQTINDGRNTKGLSIKFSYDNKKINNIEDLIKIINLNKL